MTLRSILLKKLDPDSPLIIRGTLHLATKYDVTSVRDMIIHQLECDWPLNLEEWKKMYDQQQEFLRRKVTSDNGHNLDENFPEPASAFRLAIDYNIPSILPALVYTLITTPFTNNWDEIRRNPQGVLYSKISQGKIRTVRWEILEVKEILELGRAKEHQAHEAFRLFFLTLPVTHRDGPCQTILNDLNQKYRTTSLPSVLRLSPDPFKFLREMFLGGDFETLCEPCRVSITNSLLSNITERVGRR